MENKQKALEMAAAMQQKEKSGSLLWLEEIQRAAAAAEQAHAEELAKARRQAEETAAGLNMAADESAVRFGLLFDQLQDAAGKIFDLVDTLQQGGLTEKAERGE